MVSSPRGVLETFCREWVRARHGVHWGRSIAILFAALGFVLVATRRVRRFRLGCKCVETRVSEKSLQRAGLATGLALRTPRPPRLPHHGPRAKARERESSSTRGLSLSLSLCVARLAHRRCPVWKSARARPLRLPRTRRRACGTIASR